MKRRALLLTLILLSSFGVAGGDFKDVEPTVVPVVPIVEEDKSGFYAGIALTAISTRDAVYSVDWGGDSTFTKIDWEMSPWLQDMTLMRIVL